MTISVQLCQHIMVIWVCLVKVYVCVHLQNYAWMLFYNKTTLIPWQHKLSHDIANILFEVASIPGLHNLQFERVGAGKAWPWGQGNPTWDELRTEVGKLACERCMLRVQCDLTSLCHQWMGPRVRAWVWQWRRGSSSQRSGSRPPLGGGWDSYETEVRENKSKNYT